MNGIRGVIFDLDGTIAYTIGDLRTAMNEMLTLNALPTLTEREILNNINRGALAFVRRSLPEAYREDEEYVAARYAEYDAAYSRHFCETTVPYAGIPEALKELRTAGKRLAVLSNKQHAQTAALCEKLFDAGSFDCVIGHRDYPLKPDPSAPLEIAHRLGLSPDEIALVGDSDVDMMTAHNAGMHAIGVLWGYRDRDCLLGAGAETLLEHPAELLGL